MKHYVEISPREKLRLLRAHALGIKWKSLSETKWCLHCGQQFSGHSVRVYLEGDLWLECGTLACDGSPIDWADYPWWDENHPETKARDKAEETNPELN